MVQWQQWQTRAMVPDQTRPLMADQSNGSIFRWQMAPVSFRHLQHRYHVANSQKEEPCISLCVRALSWPRACSSCSCSRHTPSRKIERHFLDSSYSQVHVQQQLQQAQDMQVCVSVYAQNFVCVFARVCYFCKCNAQHRHTNRKELQTLFLK